MRRTTLGGLAAAALLTIAAAAPAHATAPAGPLSPSTVKLATSSGAQNGCVATIPKFKTQTFEDLTYGTSPGIAMNAFVKCPASAKVGRVTWKIWLFEVRKGWMRGMNGPEGLLSSGARLLDPSLNGSFSPFQSPFGVLCGPHYPDNSGTRTWLVRATYHTHTSKSDPVAYVGHVDRQQTVTCN